MFKKKLKKSTFSIQKYVLEFKGSSSLLYFSNLFFFSCRSKYLGELYSKFCQNKTFSEKNTF